jgi:hypothetical protein
VLAAGSGLVYVAKNYIAPHLWGSSTTIQSLKDANNQTNQNINDIRGQIGELKDTLTSLKQLVQQAAVSQSAKAGDDEIAQLKRELETLTSVVHPPQDEKSKEIAELKAQISMLKASITARQSAAAPPPIPTNRSTLTWSPGDYPKQIPAWQRPATPTTPTTTTTTTSASVGQMSSGAQSELEDAQNNTPYSQSYLDIMNTVNENLPTAELNKRLGIRSDINDKPVIEQPLSKGSKQPRSKPWETKATEELADTKPKETEKEREEKEREKEKEQNTTKNAEI